MVAEEYLKKLNSFDVAFKTYKTGLSVPQFRLLQEVQILNKASISTLSSQRQVTAQSFGRMCSSLAKRGLITLEVDPRDKRVTLVSLTRKGRAVTSECMALVEKVLND